MSLSNVVIEGMAYSLPQKIYTSADIENQLSPLYEKLNLPLGRLALMTGIEERRLWPNDFKPSEASSEAGIKLLKSGIKGNEVDLLVHCAVCRDRLEPATASYVHRRMELGGSTQILDISNACLGFLNALVLVGSMIETGQIRRAILVSGENGAPLVQKTIQLLNENSQTRKSIKPFFANLTIGAGAVAWSIAHRDSVLKECPTLGYWTTETDTSHNELCEGDTSGDELIMQTDSEELLHAGISVAERAWAKFLHVNDWTPEIPELVITHQVGKAHSKAVFEALSINPSISYSSFEKLGNCGSVSLPITYTLACEANPQNLLRKTALLGIGSGLSSLMLSINP
jgi:3-oxoacyl-[acyl-carrier-protein] synthase III